MSSIQSFFFRLFAWGSGSLINRTASSIPRLRRFSRAGSDKPVLPPWARAEPFSADGVSCEWILPKMDFPGPVVLYLHGGGWVLGWYNNHRWMAAHLGKAAGSRILAVDYRLAPEHPFPAALEDCVKAYRWLLRHDTPPDTIVIAGDSAGGNLTLTTALALREAGDPLPAGLVCISPMTDLEGTGESFWANRDPLLKPDFALAMARHYAGNTPLREPLLSPQYADLSGLPPLLIHVGEDEILVSDATCLAEKACQAGVDTRLEIWPGMWHVWHMFIPFLPEAREAIEDIGRFIRMHTSAQPSLRKTGQTS